MIQIIGWLGCLYLFVKGLELLGSPNLRGADGQIRDSVGFAAVTAIIGSIGFAIWLYAQGSAAAENFRAIG